MTRFGALRAALRHPLFRTIYVPSAINSISLYMIIPILPLYAADFEASYGLIGVVLAGDRIGRMVGDVPAGLFLNRLGPKTAMMLGLGGSAVSVLALCWAQSIPEVIGYRFLAGLSSALYAISVHSYMSGAVITENRGRGIAMIGGTFRIGRFIGPTLGTTAAALFGLRAPFVLYAVASTLALSVVAYFHSSQKQVAFARGPSNGERLWAVIRNQARTLTVTGTGQLCVQITRAGWQATIPLYAADVLGLGVEMIGPIFSLSAALDMALFYPAGWIMDRKGRKYAIVPSFTIQALGLALIPLTTEFWGLLVAAALIGLGNGLSAGSMMTIGADLAPPDSRGEFLGVWRFIGDMGSAGGPLLVGGIAGWLALQASALVIAGTAGLAASVFAFLVPETLREQPVKTLTPD